MAMCGGQHPVQESSEQILGSELHGPDLYHVYIGYPQSCEALYKKITDCLHNENVTYFIDDPDRSRRDNIEEGIRNSRKMLLVLGPNSDDMDEFEKRMIHEKALYRGTKSLLLLLVDMTTEQIESCFRGYPIYDQAQDSSFTTLPRYLAQDYLPIPLYNINTNMGYTLACSYVYGYLQCILPGLDERILASGKMTLSKDKPEVDKPQVIMSKKLFIIIPESCVCPVDIKEQSSTFTLDCDIPFKATHAGHAGRDYKSVVYKFNEKNMTYKVVWDFPAALTVLWEMACAEDQALSKQDAKDELKLFYFNLRGLLGSAKFASLWKTVCLVYFKERDNFDDVIKAAVKEEIEAEKKTENMSGSMKQSPSASFIPKKNLHVKVVHPNIMKCYPMDNEIRGEAYIINIDTFSGQIKSRPGARKDQELMRELWRSLRFTVYVKENLTGKEIMELRAILSTKNFRNDQAFVMCIMSHGILGHIHSADEQLISVMDLTNDLKKNESLKGKPKMFFIQSCQTTKKEDNSSSDPESDPAGLDISVIQSPDTPTETSQLQSPDTPTETSQLQSPGTPTETSQLQSPGTPTEVNQTANQSTGSGIGNNYPEIGDLSSRLEDTHLVNECGDHEVSSVLQFDGGDGETSRAHLVPTSPDFIMSYATLPERLSYRHTEEGSIYINALHDIIMEQHKSLALNEILMKVTEFVKNKMIELFPDKSCDELQFPFYVHATEQKLYLS